MFNKEPETHTKVRFFDCDPIGHLSNIRYLDYMLNARDDHMSNEYHIDLFEESRRTGCTWVALQNQIAYLKEVRFNQNVTITSKIIFFTSKINIIEILMYNESKTCIHAVLWLTSIYFNLMTRKSEGQPEDSIKLFTDLLVEIPEKTFDERVLSLRNFNKLHSQK
ncbi:MAG: acyl-CoA thioesterase [Flavobacteriaceae bacterium]|jgi:acyl-CoA thioester hydrolase|nr:acyl-CoA thioesterase [Flavobacteriaceae bacterium]